MAYEIEFTNKQAKHQQQASRSPKTFFAYELLFQVA